MLNGLTLEFQIKKLIDKNLPSENFTPHAPDLWIKYFIYVEHSQKSSGLLEMHSLNVEFSFCLVFLTRF